MKKIFFFSSLLCISQVLSAQTEKHNWLVGGGLAFTSTRNTTFAFNPSAGYFVAKNFALGLNLDLLYEELGENKLTSFGVGPLVRYYFGKNNFRPFLNGELSFTSNKFKFPGGTNTENGNRWQLGVGGAAFLNQSIALEVITGYSHSKVKDMEGDGGLALRIGFQVYLHPKSAMQQIKTSVTE